VLDRFAKDKSLSAATRNAFRITSQLEVNWRTLRAAHTVAAQGLMAGPQKLMTLAPAPTVTVSDCANSTSLPGTPVAKPGQSSDATAKGCFVETTSVADFFESCFGRNSVDDLGMTLASSIHYGTKYNNAFWNGSQMTYGDGDQQIFVEGAGSQIGGRRS
jgi:Zn-dependent metalloprotease